MNAFASRVGVLAAQQYDVIAAWQLQQSGWSKHEIREGLRGLRRLHRGVCATGDVSEEGWYLAGALAMGPTGVVSHLSALRLMGLRSVKPGPIHVSYVGGHRDARADLVPHRRRSIERWEYMGIPVTSPTRSLLDAGLKPWELYRAIDLAEERDILLTLPLGEVVRLNHAVRGRTKSEAEARFLWLLHEAGLPLPLVNHHLNGFETDFHWPELRLVVEVDGWEHHRERRNFNTDRYRGLVHRAHGWDVVRVSADHVYDLPELVVDALALARATR